MDTPFLRNVSLFNTGRYVSLAQHKEPAFSAPLGSVPLRDRAYVPLWDPFGEPMYPVAMEGDRCARFSLLARTKTHVSHLGPSWVLSPVSGYVEKITTIEHPLLGRTFCAVIRPDASVPPLAATPHHLGAMTEEGVLRTIHQAGIIDEFDLRPLSEKILEAKERGIRELAAIALDDSPYISSALRTVSEFGAEVGDGISAVLKALDGGSARLAVYDCDELEWDENQYRFGFVEIIRMRGGFPLISKFRRQYYPAGDFLPVGVQALRCAAQALSRGIPQTNCLLTVSGECVSRPCNVIVAVGTPVEDVLRFVGINRVPNYVIMGDTMTGCTVTDMLTPVVAGTRAITVMNALPHAERTSCTRCGRCVTVCPVDLPVYEAMRHYERGQTDEAARFGAEQCTGCGACSAVCPAGLETAGVMRRLRKIARRQSKTEQ